LDQRWKVDLAGLAKHDLELCGRGSQHFEQRLHHFPLGLAEVRWRQAAHFLELLAQPRNFSHTLDQAAGMVDSRGCRMSAARVELLAPVVARGEQERRQLLPDRKVTERSGELCTPARPAGLPNREERDRFRPRILWPERRETFQMAFD